MPKPKRKVLLGVAVAFALLGGMAAYAHSSSEDIVSISAKAGDPRVRLLDCNAPEQSTAASYDHSTQQLTVKCGCGQSELKAVHYEEVRLRRAATLFSIIPVGWTHNSWLTHELLCTSSDEDIYRLMDDKVSREEIDWVRALNRKHQQKNKGALDDWLSKARLDAKRRIAQSRLESPPDSNEITDLLAGFSLFASKTETPASANPTLANDGD